MAYSKLFAEMNSTPSFFMREITPIDARSLPPLIPIYHDPKPCPKSNPLFTTVSMAAFSKENREAFPNEMLVGKGEKIQRQTNAFTNSFIAGAYRDNRMGVAELRQRRIEKIKAKQQKLSIVQKSLSDDVKKIQKRSARRLLRDIERTRRLHDLLSIESAIIIEKYVRRFNGQNKLKRMRQKILDDENARKKAIQDKVEFEAASLIARAVLRYLAYKYSRLTRQMSQRKMSMSPGSPYSTSTANSGSGSFDSKSRRSMQGKNTKGLTIDGSSMHSFQEWEDDIRSPDSTKIAVTKERANSFLNSLLRHQRDDDGKLVTSLMMKVLNESPLNQSQRSKDRMSRESGEHADAIEDNSNEAASEEDEEDEEAKLVLELREMSVHLPIKIK